MDVYRSICMNHNCTAGQTTKDSQIYKNIIYIFILRRRLLCVVGTQSKRVRTYLSFVAGTLFVKLRDGQRTHMGSWQVCLSDQRVSPFAWETSGSLPRTWANSRYLPSVQNYRPFIVFQVPRIFCLWLVIGTYILPFFSR